MPPALRTTRPGAYIVLLQAEHCEDLQSVPCRLSAKLFKCTPEQLPGDLKANLLAMLQCGVNALEGYIRPGCLHLTLNAMVG